MSPLLFLTSHAASLPYLYAPSSPNSPKTGEKALPNTSNNSAALVTVFQKDKVNISGPTKSWADTGSSGKTVHRIFCSECGSPIAHDPEAAPEIIAIKAGTLDKEQKKNLKPVCGCPYTPSACPRPSPLCIFTATIGARKMLLVYDI